jgi:hypothetical protein
MSYTDFTAADFLSDGYFREWILSPNEENSCFWENWMQTHPHQQGEIELACQLMAGLQQSLPVLPPTKAASIWAAVEAEMAAEARPAVAAGPSAARSPSPAGIRRLAAVFLGLLVACLGFVLYQKNKHLCCPPSGQGHKGGKKEVRRSACLHPGQTAPPFRQNEPS